MPRALSIAYQQGSMKIPAGNQFSFKSLESLLRSSCINQTGLVLKIFQMGEM
jgi:hypothetical protein